MFLVAFLAFLRSFSSPKWSLEMVRKLPALETSSDGLLGHINTVHSEAELYGMIGEQDAVVKLAFTWCRPCKAFLPRYEKFAKPLGM